MATRRPSVKALQAQEDRSRRALAKKRAVLAQACRQLRDAETKAHTRLRAIVGDMVLDTRLSELSLPTLQDALHALARCVHHEAGYQAFLETYGDAAERAAWEVHMREMDAWFEEVEEGPARESVNGAAGTGAGGSAEV